MGGVEVNKGRNCWTTARLRIGTPLFHILMYVLANNAQVKILQRLTKKAVERKAAEMLVVRPAVTSKVT